MSSLNISFEPPPSSIEPELQSWLNRLLVEIGIVLSQNQDLNVIYTLPDKPQVGMIRYFGAAIASTAITAEGVWAYTSAGWVQL